MEDAELETDLTEPGEEPPRSGEGVTVRRAIHTILGGEQDLSMRDVADYYDSPVTLMKGFWRAMGFPDLDPDERVFCELDREAFGAGLEYLHSGAIDAATGISLLRAQSHITDRLVLWQFEALVEDAVRRLGLDDTSARLLVLDRIGESLDILERHLIYAWRRQMASLIARTEAEIAHRGFADEVGPDTFPLLRSMGFVDMVAYTRRSATLGPYALADLVQGFELTARDVITSRGARVVKTIGDAVFFIADDLRTAAEVACDLIVELQDNEKLLPVRASLVQGNVVSRSGDVFGPPVNLASRLVDVAPTGQVLTDPATAQAIKSTKLSKRFQVREASAADLRGMGTVVPFFLERKKRS